MYWRFEIWLGLLLHVATAHIVPLRVSRLSPTYPITEGWSLACKTACTVDCVICYQSIDIFFYFSSPAPFLKYCLRMVKGGGILCTHFKLDSQFSWVFPCRLGWWLFKLTEGLSLRELGIMHTLLLFYWHTYMLFLSLPKVNHIEFSLYSTHCRVLTCC